MKQQDGFTLIEIIIVLAVSSVLLMGLLNLFDWHQKVYLLEDATVRTTMDVRSTLNTLTEYIAQSTNVVASRNFDGTVYTTGGSTLILEVPSVNSSDNVIPATYDYFLFYLNNGEVFQQIELGAGSVRTDGSKRVAENVQSFSLTYNNGNLSAVSAVTVDMQTVIATRNGNVTTRVVDTIFLRNK